MIMTNKNLRVAKVNGLGRMYKAYRGHILLAMLDTAYYEDAYMHRDYTKMGYVHTIINLILDDKNYRDEMLDASKLTADQLQYIMSCLVAYSWLKAYMQQDGHFWETPEYHHSFIAYDIICESNARRERGANGVDWEKVKSLIDSREITANLDVVVRKRKRSK